ncbi:hypothetical protein GGR58DRAFT_253234 [Xylaria digitata]|nr:hypothetical protein GGR58DRAFT_253234 [Xylaria digitata]
MSWASVHDWLRHIDAANVDCNSTATTTPAPAGTTAALPQNISRKRRLISPLVSTAPKKKRQYGGPVLALQNEMIGSDYDVDTSQETPRAVERSKFKSDNTSTVSTPHAPSLYSEQTSSASIRSNRSGRSSPTKQIARLRDQRQYTAPHDG